MMRRSSSLFASLVLSGAMAVVSAQADTWSSLPQSQPEVSAKIGVPKSAPTSRSAQLLFGEIEVLKQEVQTLQARIEEQSNELRKVKKEQKERYLDLDRRLGQLLNSAAVPVVTDKKSAQGKFEYDVAFGFMKNKQLEDAALAFKAFLNEYPKSALVVNGYYWLGQIYYNQINLDEARKAFSIVINQYPDHVKTSDSKYKLGVILHRLGDVVKAKGLLESVVEQYAGSASARFASKYLKEHLSK
jgi:tol-pal system protein YbgF